MTISKRSYWKTLLRDIILNCTELLNEISDASLTELIMQRLHKKCFMKRSIEKQMHVFFYYKKSTNF